MILALAARNALEVGLNGVPRLDELRAHVEACSANAQPHEFPIHFDGRAGTRWRVTLAQAIATGSLAAACSTTTFRYESNPDEICRPKCRA
ncbi:hypothetical protein PEC18_30140 [Paucibacter sp. O1-1]|nr:hypothetical protein [Paucibacter sp. O1-1]MDA3829981.1 hypothetical protein [Paucibacter sp. O1-1]